MSAASAADTIDATEIASSADRSPGGSWVDPPRPHPSTHGWSATPHTERRAGCPRETLASSVPSLPALGTPRPGPRSSNAGGADILPRSRTTGREGCSPAAEAWAGGTEPKPRFRPRDPSAEGAVPVHRVPVAYVQIEQLFPWKLTETHVRSGGDGRTHRHAPTRNEPSARRRPENYASIRDRSSVAAELEMNSLRGATSFPIKRSNTCSDASRSEMLIRRSVRTRGSIVVSAS